MKRARQLWLPVAIIAAVALLALFAASAAIARDLACRMSSGAASRFVFDCRDRVEVASTPTAHGAHLLNVPLLPVTTGHPSLNANNRAIFWFGTVSRDDNFAEVRVVGALDGLRVRTEIFDRTVRDGDAVHLELAGTSHTVTWPDAGEWELGSRCGSEECRGWDATLLLPWERLGAVPRLGDRWPMTVTVVDIDDGDARTSEWAGTLQWVMPEHLLPSAASGLANPAPHVAQITLPLTADAMVGGGTDCGAPDFPDYFPGWGTRNWGDSPYINIQSQWDVADWPCFSRYYAAWSLDTVPAGAEVVSATLTLRQFGQAGFEPGDTGETVVQVFEITDSWEEPAISWDDAPATGENVSWQRVPEAPCGYCDPALPYAFDVTEIVRRALAGGRKSASAALYTAAGQYHSGKYFWSREGQSPPVIQIAYLVPAAVQGSLPPTGVTPPRPSPKPTPVDAAPPRHAAATQPGTSARPLATPAPTATVAAEVVDLPTITPGMAGEPGEASPAATETAGQTYFIGPAGDDAASGLSEDEAWATFDRAWRDLLPGDTLIVMDGVYRQILNPNVRNGLPGSPITIRAQNDGKAIIDGENSRITVKLGDTWPGPIGDWFVLEGIVARNSVESVWLVRGEHNVLRRVSGYDANPDTNDHVFVIWSNNNLIEDCIASGTGRDMILIFEGEGNTIRRCFAAWSRWDGREFCGVMWPNGNNIVVYNASNNLVENSIAYGNAPGRAFLIQANADGVEASNNRVLGSIALLTGKNLDGSLKEFGDSPPAGACNGYMNPARADYRAGLALYGQGRMSGNVWRDVLAIDNAGLGFSAARPYGIGVTDGVLDHATILGNGEGAVFEDGGAGANVNPKQLAEWSITNARIEGTEYTGEGARLTARYLNGELTREALWPWPMDARAEAELGYRITDAVAPFLAR